MATPIPSEVERLLNNCEAAVKILRLKYEDSYQAGYERTKPREDSEIRSRGVSDPTADVVIHNNHIRQRTEKSFRHISSAEAQLRSAVNVLVEIVESQDRYLDKYDHPSREF